MAWVTLEHHFTMLVDEHYVWNALNFIECGRFLVHDYVVFKCCPSLGANMCLHLHDRSVDAKANDTHSAARLLVVPGYCVFYHHFLVVRHWSLARWAPRCPEVNQEHLALSVFNYLRRYYHRICLFASRKLQFLQALDFLERLEFFGNAQSLRPDHFLTCAVVLRALHPHMIV